MSSRVMRLEIVMSAPSRQLHGGACRSVLRAVPVDLEGLDILEPVHDPATDLDEVGPSPVQRQRSSVRGLNVPASRQLDLGEVRDAM